MQFGELQREQTELSSSSRWEQRRLVFSVGIGMAQGQATAGGEEGALGPPNFRGITTRCVDGVKGSPATLRGVPL